MRFAKRAVQEYCHRHSGMRSKCQHPARSGHRVRQGHISRPRRHDGITLIELLVVLGLLVVITSIVLPNFERLTASATRDTQREHILNQFAGLGVQAMLNGRDFVVLGTEPIEEADAVLAGRVRYPLDVPTGWEVLLDEPILVRASGVCLGGHVTLLHQELDPIYIELKAPYCRVDAT